MAAAYLQEYHTPRMVSIMAQDIEAVRAELVRLASQKRTRSSAFTRERPVDWSPSTVMHPDHGMYFQDAGAWSFIVELLEAGHPITPVQLTKPPGATGYELLFERAGHPTIYIKLELCSGRVHGRSFHNSTKEKAPL